MLPYMPLEEAFLVTIIDKEIYSHWFWYVKTLATECQMLTNYEEQIITCQNGSIFQGTKGKLLFFWRKPF